MLASFLSIASFILVPFGLGVAVAVLAGGRRVNSVDGPSVKVTKSILCLWFGSAVSTACAAFNFGAEHVYKLMLDGGDYNGSDGPLEISIGLPLIGTYALGFIAAIVALVGFILSWSLNKQPFVSRPHLACLLFLLPLALWLIVRNDV